MAARLTIRSSSSSSSRGSYRSRGSVARAVVPEAIMTADLRDATEALLLTPLTVHRLQADPEVLQLLPAPLLPAHQALPRRTLRASHRAMRRACSCCCQAGRLLAARRGLGKVTLVSLFRLGQARVCLPRRVRGQQAPL